VAAEGRFITDFPGIVASESLLASKAAVDAVDKKGNTPLHKASGGQEYYSAEDFLDNKDVVTSLLASKAAVDAVDKKGNTPLHKASGGQEYYSAEDFLDNKDVVTSLPASKAAVNAVSLNGASQV
jgi:ankyrin repeat protein